MIDSNKIQAVLVRMPWNDIIYLWEIGQEHEYNSIGGGRDWNIEDEFWRQVGYEMRRRG